METISVSGVAVVTQDENNRVVNVVLIFSAEKKLKPCGSNLSPIFYTNFRSI